MARSHPLGQLLLREAELHALADHQPRELLVRLLLFKGGLVRSALADPLLMLSEWAVPIGESFLRAISIRSH